MIIFAIVFWGIGLGCLLFMTHYFMRRRHVAASVVFIVVFIQLFIRPLLFFIGVDTPYPHNEFGSSDWLLVSSVLVLALIWIIFFSLSYQVSLRPATIFEGFFPSVSNGYSFKIVALAAIFTTFIGSILTIKFITDAGSLVNFIYSVKIGKQLAGSYVVRETSVVGVMFSLLGLISYAKRCKENNLKIFSSRMVWLFVVLLLINCISNYAWGNRYSIALMLLSLFFAWHFHIKRISFFKLVIYLLLAITLLQGLKVVRNTAVKEAVGSELVSTQEFWLNFSTSLHLTQFDAFMLAVRDAGDRFEYRNGKDFLNGLLSWVPRSLYPAKETFYVGGWFRRVYQPSVVNGWPVTTMGSWYVNFGLLGILFGALISGFVAAIFDASFRSAKNSSWQAAIAPVLAFFLFDGGLGTGFFQGLVLYVMPIFLLAFILRVFKGNRRYSTVQ